MQCALTPQSPLNRKRESFHESCSAISIIESFKIYHLRRFATIHTCVCNIDAIEIMNEMVLIIWWATIVSGRRVCERALHNIIWCMRGYLYIPKYRCSHRRTVRIKWLLLVVFFMKTERRKYILTVSFRDYVDWWILCCVLGYSILLRLRRLILGTAWKNNAKWLLFL